MGVGIDGHIAVHFHAEEAPHAAEGRSNDAVGAGDVAERLDVEVAADPGEDARHRGIGDTDGGELHRLGVDGGVDMDIAADRSLAVRVDREVGDRKDV